LTDIWRVLSQNTTTAQVYHTLSAAYLTGAAFVVGIASIHLWRAKRARNRGVAPDERQRRTTAVMRTSLRVALFVGAAGGLLVAISGDTLGKVMFEQQPMKMAAAEALWDTQEPAPFSVFAVGNVNQGRNDVELEIPGLLSFLAEGNFHAAVPGINDVAAQEAETYGGDPKHYIPNIFVAYWGFRLMIGFGMTSFVAALIGLWTTRRKWWVAEDKRTAEDEVPRLMLTRNREFSPWFTKWSWRLGIWTLGFPLIANSFGWIFTEMGRQPWVVFGVLQTANGVSPDVSQGEVITSLSLFTALYGILAIVEVRLLAKYANAGPPVDEEPPRKDPTLRPKDDEDADQPMAFAY
ncbi:MAG: cytochrome ubiquinol oxidase subunit I, partial [Streptomycetaceae bacterium]|nr:cytochrome ubiquinol oxidase subunit I [Streptomycetaceae bacterium]